MWATLARRHTSPFPILVSLSLSLSFEGSHTTHVYLAFHAKTGYSPLHQAVNHGMHRLSLSLLHTADHVS